MNTNLKFARLAGVLYLIVVFGGIFAEMGVRSSIIVPGNAAATVQNVMENKALFRIGFVSDLVAHTFYFLLAFALYWLLKATTPKAALLFLFIVAIGTAILCFNMLNQFMALLLLTDADYMQAFGSDQLSAQAMLFTDLHKYGYLIAQIFYGGWLLPLGYAVYKSGYFPRMLGVLLMAGAVTYLMDFLGIFLVPGYGTSSNMLVLIPAVIAEMSFCGWLVIKGAHSAAPKQAATPFTALAH